MGFNHKLVQYIHVRKEYIRIHDDCVPCAYLDKNKTETSHKNQNETHKSPIVFRILAGARYAYIQVYCVYTFSREIYRQTHQSRHIFDIDVARQIQYFFPDVSGRYNIKINCICLVYTTIYGAVRQTKEFYNMTKCVRLHLQQRDIGDARPQETKKTDIVKKNT